MFQQYLWGPDSAAGEVKAYSYVLSRANIVEYPIKFKFRFVATKGLL